MPWEYKVIQLSSPVSDYSAKKAEEALSGLETLLNQAGEDGWELVNTFDTSALGYTKSVVAVFKRPKT
jgi:hypothetical protein